MTDNNSNNSWNQGNRGDKDTSLLAFFERILRLLFDPKHGDSARGSNNTPNKEGKAFFVALVILLVAWFAYDSVHIIDQVERGVVRRFGAYVGTIDPGFNIRFPRPIERVDRVEVARVRFFNYEATMLTQDENIVDVEAVVQWKIIDPKKYLFHVNDRLLSGGLSGGRQRLSTIEQVASTAVRTVIGRSKLDFVLTEGRSDIATQQHKMIQKILDEYDLGIRIIGVEMQPIKPPEQVKSAFDEAIKAREDEQRYINEAEAYQNEVIPKARGRAARLLEEAEASRQSFIAKAEGDVALFLKLLKEYRLAPEVMVRRMYLSSVENVLQKNNKILVDLDAKNPILYLPIERDAETSQQQVSRHDPVAPVISNQTDYGN